jgi:hypothetical protein
LNYWFDVALLRASPIKGTDLALNSACPPKQRTVYQDIERFTLRVEREIVAGLGPREILLLRRTLDKLDQQIEENVLTHSWEDFLFDKD